MGHRHLFVLSLGLALLLIATAHAGGHARGAGAITQQGMDDGVGSMMRSMVGSRPPSCAGRCWWCGGRRCEAVQVPITPQEQDKSRRHGSGGGGGGGGWRSTRDGSSGASSSSAQQQHQQRRRPSTSSYDDHSNYKPLSWRCKCGGG
ncbi:EPIDERMAL PATTERNING FACTOR-like protein 2 [Miscanthus floridulus]|uniref:EPIDERMAL PATTERNING FACTOR-like protein 2 n=1 Tax=Miscanthus floridulus TaxID=154761 RepID=UPI00345A6318